MTTWIFLKNTFLTSTEDSYRQCRKIGDYTLNALQAQSSHAFFLNLYTNFLPFMTAYHTKYDAWLAQLGTQKGKTNSLNVLLRSLQSEKIARWDIQIQTLYPQNSSEYIALLPHRRSPFQTGSQVDRIAAVSALSINLTGITALSATKTDVDAFLLLLTNAFNDQKAHINTTHVDSTALDAARVAVCIELYGILGALMTHFKTNPIDADNFFDTESIRNHEQVLFRHNLHSDELRLALTHTFIAGEDIRLINQGNTTLHFALCAAENDPIGSTFVSVNAHDETIVAIEALGSISSRFLKVKNMSATEGGRYTIMLL